MKAWRWIAVVLVALALISAFAFTYNKTARADAIEEARAEASRRAALEAGSVSSEVAKFRVLPFVLTELPDVAATLVDRSSTASARLNTTLKALASQTGASAIYAIDRSGTARSASNAGTPDSFVGYDFRFRPYFARAMRDGSSEYFAQGSVTGRPGLFLARRVGTGRAAAGVIVVKLEFDALERLLRSAGRISLVTDRDGVILISTDRTLRFRALRELSSARRAALQEERQFGTGTLQPARLRFERDDFATTADGTRYVLSARTLPILGWTHLHFEPVKPALDGGASRVRFATLLFALATIGVVGFAAWIMTRGRRLAMARAQLEQEVARRTVELSEAYAHLQREGEERAKADSRYRAAREELAQANRLGSIGTITTSVAHEINQPVAAIRAAADNSVKFLARGQHDRIADNLKLIASLTQRIGSITGELLSYARRGRAEVKTLALDDVVDGTLLLIGDSFRRASVALHVEHARALPRIRASRIRLEQVLVNLLQNALDAADGQPRATVLLIAATNEHAAIFEVHDNGPGIAADLGDTIFRPFVSGKPRGTGLGLGISREILRDYAGTLEAGRSHLGGAMFVVTLPLAGKDAA